MIEEKKLIEDIKKYLTDTYEGDIEDIGLCEVIEIIEKQSKLNSGWISVNERLPNEEECNKHKTDKLSSNHRKFLCTIKISDYGRQTRELYFSEIFGWKYGAEDYNQYVTAWQPLPEPYKEVEHED